MPGRHKRRPLSFRAGERLEEWARAEAARRGVAVSALLAAALAAYKRQCEEEK